MSITIKLVDMKFFDREQEFEKLLTRKMEGDQNNLVALHLMLEYKPIILLQGFYSALLSLFFVGQLTR